MKITILGSGAYGLALAKIIDENGYDVNLWTKVLNEYNVINNKEKDNSILNGFVLSRKMNITMDMQEAVYGAKIIFIATSIKYIKSILDELVLYYDKSMFICIACKGICDDELYLPYDLVVNKLKSKNVSIISGGTFAKDMIKDIPMALTLASKDNNNLIKNILENKNLKIETSNDIIGVELCGAIKNILAIGCGIIDGYGFPITSKCMYMSKVINELVLVISLLGGKKETILSYAGIGDIWLTCNSFNSRNYTLGYIVGSNKDKEEIDNYIESNTIEGLYTLNIFYNIINEKKINMNIINVLYKIIYQEGDIKLILEYLTK